MPVDTAAYVGDFDATSPLGSVPASEIDDNIRQVKAGAKNSFPNVKGAVTANHTELSRVAGVTAPIQTQLDAKAPTASPTFTGTPAAPTASPGTSTTQLATTAFTQAAIAAVNATSGNLVRSTSANASVTVAAGQLVACTNSGAVAVTFPASPTVGTVCGVWFDNGRTDNTVDLGARSVIGPNGTSFSGVMTVDQPAPVVLAWYGDYWRAA
jgi:hypothetical protein